MSGAEVVGLVLGVLPLIVSAVENYEAAFRPFLTFSRYCNELRDFRTDFATQRQLFQNHCLILLASQIDSDEAEEILRSGANPKWRVDKLGEKELALETKLKSYLGQNLETCVSLIIRIEETLMTIQEKTNGLNDEASNCSSIGDKVWRRETQQKIKFCFSKSRLNDSVEKLRQLNRDFLSLRETIRSLHEIKGKTLSTPKRDAKKCMHKFKVVQTASLSLYEALANIWKCSAHSKHSVDISLDADSEKSPNTIFEAPITPRVRFEMAFKFPTSGGQPIWLEVESNMTFCGDTSTAPASSIVSGRSICDLTTSLKRRVNTFLDTNIEDPRKTGKKEPCKKVSFKIPAGTEDSIKPQDVVMSNTESFSHSTPPMKDLIPDLRSKQDLCLHLQQCSQTCPLDTSICVGILQRTTTCSQIVYRLPIMKCQAKSMSLETLISSVSKDKPTSGLTSIERVRLARSLAIAVLQFHSTPWLPETWRSRNISFYSLDNHSLQQPGLESAPHSRIQSPYLQYQVAARSQHQPRTDTMPSPIRNNVLFGLGVILLELGFESTLRSQQRDEDLHAGQEHDFTDFLVARRLKAMIGTPMGARYGRVARKCLDCDFGVGEYDLRNLELQGAFYEDVICELDRLEAMFRKLDLLTPYRRVTTSTLVDIDQEGAHSQIGNGPHF